MSWRASLKQAELATLNAGKGVSTRPNDDGSLNHSNFFGLTFPRQHHRRDDYSDLLEKLEIGWKRNLTNLFSENPK